MPEPNFTLARRAYRANIKFVDEQVGAILADLDSLGFANNTWVMFISDHGDGQGDHHFWRKSFPYELSTHVPGILAWPRGAAVAMAPGTVSPLLGELRDVFPTALDLAGVTPPAGRVLNGSSWGCLVLKDPSGAQCGPGGAAWRSYLDLEHDLIFNAVRPAALLWLWPIARRFSSLLSCRICRRTTGMRLSHRADSSTYSARSFLTSSFLT
jgi:arylsulfatase